MKIDGIPDEGSTFGPIKPTKSLGLPEPYHIHGLGGDPKLAFIAKVRQESNELLSKVYDEGYREGYGKGYIEAARRIKRRLRESVNLV